MASAQAFQIQLLHNEALTNFMLAEELHKLSQDMRAIEMVCLTGNVMTITIEVYITNIAILNYFCINATDFSITMRVNTAHAAEPEVFFECAPILGLRDFSYSSSANGPIAKMELHAQVTKEMYNVRF